MKLLAYVFLMLTCLVNWMAVAYRPLSHISQYISHACSLRIVPTSFNFLRAKSVPQAKSYSTLLAINSISGQVSRYTIHLWDSSLLSTQAIVATVCLMSFFSVQDNGSLDSANRGSFAGFDAVSSFQYFTRMFGGDSVGSSRSAASKARAQRLGRPSSDSSGNEGQLVGFMDYDPKTAALLSHRTSVSNRNNRQSRGMSMSTSWFSI